MPLIITTTLIILASLSGLIFLAHSFSEWLQHKSTFIIAFSAGIFSVVTYDLFLETFEFAQNWMIAVGSIALGFFIFHFAEKLFPEIHHHEEDEHACHHSKRNVIWGDILHNIGDGALLAVAFTVDVRVGVIAGIGIFIHEFIQEITEFSILKLSGMSTKKALFINFLVSLSIIPGIFIGLYFAQIDYFIAILFGLAGGAFAHLIFTDLIPHSISHSKKEQRYFVYVFMILAGIATLLAVNELGGGHGHSDEELHMDGLSGELVDINIE